MKIKEMSEENRPRERLEREGVSVLSNAELLAIILKSGTPKENVLEICHKLLAKYGLEKLSTSSIKELTTEHGIGQAKACQIVALFGLYQRLNVRKRESTLITCAREVAGIYLPRFLNQKKEHFLAIYLNAKNRIIGDQVITVGLVNVSLIHPREVFYGAIKNLATAVIVVHNHPSGDCTPSKEDEEATERLRKTGEIMGIKLLDHIILGHDSWWSWKESRMK